MTTTMSSAPITVQLGIALTLEGPVLTQSTSAGDAGFDVVMARNSDGNVYLPYSLVKGRVRQSLRDFGEAINDVFGEPGEQVIRDLLGPEPRLADDGEAIDAVGPQREPGRIRFRDFVASASLADSVPITRIEIDEFTEAVSPGQLQVVEGCFEAGQTVPFVGEARFAACNKQDAEETTRLLLAALRWTSSYGAERSVGFGRLVDARISSVRLWSGASTPDVLESLAGSLAGAGSSSSATPPDKPRSTSECEATIEFNSGADGNGKHQPAATVRPAAVAADAPARLGMRVRIADPFVVGWNQSQNLFRSEEVLTGAVLKGMFAEALRILGSATGTHDVSSLAGDPVWGTLAEEFARIRMTHAFPAKELDPTRAVAVPLSQVAAKVKGDTRLVDVALLDAENGGPEKLLFGKPRCAPRFQVDWKPKEWKVANDAFGQVGCDRELRIRTQIDPSTRRAADQLLFGYEMVTPNDRVWCGWLSLDGVKSDRRPAVIEQLQRLARSGMCAIGKTKAPVEVEFVDEEQQKSKCDSSLKPMEGHWIVSLQTAALLCDPRNLSPSKLREAPSARAALHAEYQNSFGQLAAGTLELVRYFATQSLAGGFLHWRFRRNQLYNPWLLTDPGSVFVLRAKGDTERATAYIEQWVQDGLPVPGDVAARYGLDGEDQSSWWNRCPFIPQNGFGEVAVNLACHQCPEAEGQS